MKKQRRKMKNEFKKYAAGIVVITIIGVALIGIAASGVKSKYTTYKEEAVAILTKYKDGKYDEDEARERLDDLENDVWSEKIRSAAQTDKDKYEYLESELNAIIRSLRRGVVRDTDVDITIKHIKTGR